MMRKTILLLSFSLFLLIAFTSQIHALTLSYGDGYYVGYTFDASPASAAWEAAYINELISGPADTGYVQGASWYDAGVDQTLTAGTTFATGTVFPDADPLDSDDSLVGTSFINTGGWEYVLGKYDGGDAGALVWYIGGSLVGQTIDIQPLWNPDNPEDINPNKYQLSHYSLYNSDEGGGGGGGDPIPEPATFMLFGIGLLGLARVSRRKK